MYEDETTIELTIQKIEVPELRSVLPSKKGVYVFTKEKIFIFDYSLDASLTEEVTLPLPINQISDLSHVHSNKYKSAFFNFNFLVFFSKPVAV